MSYSSPPMVITSTNSQNDSADTGPDDPIAPPPEDTPDSPAGASPNDSTSRPPTPLKSYAAGLLLLSLPLVLSLFDRENR